MWCIFTSLRIHFHKYGKNEKEMCYEQFKGLECVALSGFVSDAVCSHRMLHIMANYTHIPQCTPDQVVVFMIEWPKMHHSSFWERLLEETSLEKHDHKAVTFPLTQQRKLDCCWMFFFFFFQSLERKEGGDWNWYSENIPHGQRQNFSWLRESVHVVQLGQIFTVWI